MAADERNRAEMSIMVSRERRVFFGFGWVIDKTDTAQMGKGGILGGLEAARILLRHADAATIQDQ